MNSDVVKEADTYLGLIVCRRLSGRATVRPMPSREAVPPQNLPHNIRLGSASISSTTPPRLLVLLCSFTSRSSHLYALHHSIIMALNEAKVKSVLSGDTIILHHINNPSQERTLSLAFVSASRLKRDGDVVRCLCHFVPAQRRSPSPSNPATSYAACSSGKVVHFRVLYRIPTGAAREYGLLWLPNNAQILEHAVAEGWVKVRDDAGRKDDSPESAAMVEKLQMLEARARADSKGLWAESGGRIECLYDAEPDKLLNEWKGQPADGAVQALPYERG